MWPIPFRLHYGPGRHAKVVSVKSSEFKAESASAFKSDPPLTGDESRVAEVRDVPFPELLHPVDDQPPATIITGARRVDDGWHVRGVSEDNGDIKQVVVNGVPAKATRGNFAEWEVMLETGLPPDGVIKAVATDAAGNVEQLPHAVVRP